MDAQKSASNQAFWQDQHSIFTIWNPSLSRLPWFRKSYYSTSPRFVCSGRCPFGPAGRDRVKERKERRLLAVRRLECRRPSCLSCHRKRGCFSSRAQALGSQACRKRWFSIGWLNGCSSQNHRVLCARSDCRSPKCSQAWCPCEWRCATTRTKVQQSAIGWSSSWFPLKTPHLFPIFSVFGTDSLPQRTPAPRKCSFCRKNKRTSWRCWDAAKGDTISRALSSFIGKSRIGREAPCKQLSALLWRQISSRWQRRLCQTYLRQSFWFVRNRRIWKKPAPRSKSPELLRNRILVSNSIYEHSTTAFD